MGGITATAGTILLVEDDPNDALLIRRACGKARIANPLQEVSDGEQAVAYLEGRGEYADRQRHPTPMLVLLDLKLPRKSGFEVLAWIRADPVLKRTPVVVLTASRETVDINRAYDAGANSYLVKPVGFDALLEMVKTLDMYWAVLNEGPQAGPA